MPQKSACSNTINSIPLSNDFNYLVISAIDNKHNYALLSFGNAKGLALPMFGNGYLCFLLMALITHNWNHYSMEWN